MPKILYIAGMGRSGSTLLDMMLGEIEGFFSAGELQLYWETVAEEGWKKAAGWRCGCGREVSKCDVWSSLAKNLNVEKPPLPVSELLATYHTHIRSQPRQMGRLAASSIASGHAGALRDYALAMERVYRALVAATGARVVVDSSKLPHAAYALATHTDVSLRVVQLVRDPRGVAFSFGRQKREPGQTIGGFPRVDPLRVSVAWSLRQAFIETALRRRLGMDLMLLRYEDLVEYPESAVRRVVEFVGESFKGLRFRDAHTVLIGDNHLISGNPLRFDRGLMSIRADNEWKAKMPIHARFAAVLPALPLIHRYGYRLRARGPSGYAV
jgi:hypothetical protein